MAEELNGREQRETELWQVLDWSLWGNGLGDVLREAICAGCDVRAECLDEALIENMKWGVWGGTTERERRVLRKQRGLARRAVPAAVRAPEPGEAA